MAIRSTQIWITSKGTKCGSELEALELEYLEIIEDTINFHQHYDEYLMDDFLKFLRESSDAVAFVEAINAVVSKNPHFGFKPAPNQKVT